VLQGAVSLFCKKEKVDADYQNTHLFDLFPLHPQKVLHNIKNTE